LLLTILYSLYTVCLPCRTTIARSLLITNIEHGLPACSDLTRQQRVNALARRHPDLCGTHPLLSVSRGVLVWLLSQTLLSSYFEHKHLLPEFNLSSVEYDRSSQPKATIIKAIIEIDTPCSVDVLFKVWRRPLELPQSFKVLLTTLAEEISEAISVRSQCLVQEEGISQRPETSPTPPPKRKKRLTKTQQRSLNRLTTRYSALTFDQASENADQATPVNRTPRDSHSSKKQVETA
jgi:hypothetical protein